MRLGPQSSHHAHEGSHVRWQIGLIRLTVVIISWWAGIPTHQLGHLELLRFPLINHTPGKPIRHTLMKKWDRKTKRKSVKSQCNLVKNNNDKRRRKNKTDKDANLMELMFYSEETGGEQVNKSLQNSDARRKQWGSINPRGRWVWWETWEKAAKPQLWPTFTSPSEIGNYIARPSDFSRIAGIF